MKRQLHIVLLFTLSLMALSSIGFAQRDSVNKATSTLQDQSLPSELRITKALEIIDKAIMSPDCINYGYAWYARGFIYKEHYKKFESQNKKSKTRLDAVEYLKRAYELLSKDTSASANDFRTSTKQTLKYLGSTFYNDAGFLLDTVNYKTAIENYEKFKECILIAEPNYNLRPREIEFKTVLADQYGKLFRNNIKTNTRFLGDAEIAYKEVITLDTNNGAANYNLAMLYYNYGVDIINAMDIDLPILDVDKIQDEAKESFRKALPYMQKAYSINPKNKNVLIALQGIYFSLYEFGKSDEYKAKLEQIEKEK